MKLQVKHIQDDIKMEKALLAQFDKKNYSGG
jgi:hypothetical protein